ncbi:MAG: BREX system P-loop protein BrxC, partial [Defluviitaleaceae bacterium]|nr:BREX system P-loop protein BrxC [Defluviitaleaceae bacterium]
PLSSQNVDEVIKKRLLDKREAATDKLQLLYEEKATILKNLINFSAETPEKRLYDSAEDFAEVYPFIPYQFKLLQEVFNGIRTHGASGKHLSEGERSLLNAFQEAAIEFMNSDDGAIIPFDAFYRTVETFLDHNIRRVILYAEESAGIGNVLTPDDLIVLKILFMVKYISNSMPANFENITTLMLTNIDEDRILTAKRLEVSLRRLEAERLIIKHGDQYIFLTNEEQDINREIKEIHIDPSVLIDGVGKEIFAALFDVEKKYRHNERYDFGFNTIIDDRLIGNQKDEISLHVLTPYYANGAITESAIKVMTMGKNNVIVALPQNDTEFLEEMEQTLQIEAFLRKNTGKTATDAVEDIKTTKNREMQQRIARCKNLIIEALKKAGIYVNSLKLDIREKAPRQRINDGFNMLIEQLYHKQSYIVKPFDSVENLRELITAKDNRQIELDASAVTDVNHLAITDMTDVIEKSNRINKSVTLRSIYDQFGKMPYGWLTLDIAGILLTIFKNQKIRLELSGENISLGDLRILDYISKKEYLDRLVVKWRDLVSHTLINNAKDIAAEVFGRTDIPSDEDGIMARLKEFAAIELNGSDDSIKDLLHEYTKRYPGEQVLKDGKKLLEQLERFKDSKSFYEFLHANREALEDYSEDVQDVKKFFKNQRAHFDNALKMIDIYEGNRSYVLDEETIRLIGEIEKITMLASPYSEIHRLPDLVEQFRTRFGKLLEDECIPIRADIEADQGVTLADLKRRDLKERQTEFENKVRSDYKALLQRLDRANNVYEAIAMKTESDRMKQRFVQSFIDEETRLARLEAEKNNVKPDCVPNPKSKCVSVKSLIVGATRISNEEDIERVVNEVRTRLKAQLEPDTTILIV